MFLTLDEMKENGKKWVELNQELIEKIKKLEYQSLYKRQERAMLFESFLVFYMLEVLVLVSVAVWYYYEPKVQEKKIWDPWGIWKEK